MSPSIGMWLVKACSPGGASTGTRAENRSWKLAHRRSVSNAGRAYDKCPSCERFVWADFQQAVVMLGEGPPCFCAKPSLQKCTTKYAAPFKF